MVWPGSVQDANLFQPMSHAIAYQATFGTSSHLQMAQQDLATIRKPNERHLPMRLLTISLEAAAPSSISTAATRPDRMEGSRAPMAS